MSEIQKDILERLNRRPPLAKSADSNASFVQTNTIVDANGDPVKARYLSNRPLLPGAPVASWITDNGDRFYTAKPIERPIEEEPRKVVILPFEIVIEITPNDRNYVLRIQTGGTSYNASINWGDGAASSQITQSQINDAVENDFEYVDYLHEYPDPADEDLEVKLYTIKIRGRFYGIDNRDVPFRPKLLATNRIQNLENLTRTFYNRGMFSSYNDGIPSVKGTIPLNVPDLISTFFANNLTEWTIAIPRGVVNLIGTWEANFFSEWNTAIPQGVESIAYAWYNNVLVEWNTTFPDDVTENDAIVSGVKDFSYAWFGNLLTSWDVPLPSSALYLTGAWEGNNITVWTQAIPDRVEDISRAWAGNPLTSWNVVLPSSLQNISYAWAECLLNVWTQALPIGITTIDFAWSYNNLTEWSTAIPSTVISANGAWLDNPLVEWVTPLPANLKYLNDAWSFCGLSEWTIAIPASVEEVEEAWKDNNLSSWDIAMPNNLVTAEEAWKNNPTLTNFDGATAFTDCTCINFRNAFENTSLSPDSYDSILVALNATGTSNGDFTQTGGITYSPVGAAAIAAMQSRGWTFNL